MIFRDRLTGQTILPSRRPLDQPLAQCATQLLTVDACAEGIGRRHHLLPTRQTQEPLSGRRSHV